MLLRTERVLARYRLLLAAALAVGLVHCGDAEGEAQDDLLAADDSADANATDADSAAPDSSGPNSGEAPATSTRNLTGNWGMFLFEDPVAIRLEQEGDVLTGVGCCLPDLIAAQYCCGLITGSVDGDTATFSFPLGDLGDSYRAEIVVSEDRTRLGGTFYRDDAAGTPLLSVKSAWLRYGFEQETWLTSYPELEEELRDMSGSVLRLSDVSKAGDGYEHGEEYTLRTTFGSVGGELGPFWGSELRVRESDGAIVAGPVPITDPRLPETMVLHRDGKTLQGAEVTMPSGASYRFDVVSPGER